MTNEQSSPLPPTRIDLTQGQKSKFWGDKSFKSLVLLVATIVGLLILGISFILLLDAWPAISKFGISFLWGREWDIRDGIFGAFPFIYGTLVTSAIALIFAIPLGLAIAFLTTEDFLPQWLQQPISFLVELIAGIPSVIIGLWGIFVFVPALFPFKLWLHETFNWIPLFSTAPINKSILDAGLILAFMILPIIAAISREVLLALPPTLRSGSMALGATRWETISRTLLPAGFPGIIGAIMLALGRALGETMAVTMVIGNARRVPASLMEAGSTIPSILANQFGEAEGGLHLGSLMYLALILFLITFVINAMAVALIKFLGWGNKASI
ncbi:MAG: phosphate ABC transporter permease subunit PstC [Halothece sp.]